MDRIEIKRLEIYANHGCYQEERALGQRFYLSAVLYPSAGSFSSGDRLEDTFNYAEICTDIKQWMTGETWSLIETCAVKIAERILSKYQNIRKAEIEVEKPQAPMALPFDTVLAHAEREWHKVYLSIGSNLGDRKQYLDDACRMLDMTEAVRLCRISNIYETAPYGKTDQPAFLNACLELDTWLAPQTLLETLHRIEQALGRRREVHWGPRTIDLDIIFYDHEVIDTQTLHIPHVDMANRLFVLKPLSEIAGYVRHPILGITVDEMLKKQIELT